VHPLRVVGVRVELPANQPVVLLREEDGVRYLPIWIGAVEASAIAFQQQGVHTVRPLTHDLMRDMNKALGERLEAVHITEMREDIYYAELRFSGGVAVSARPSDAIALDLRCEVEILG
jgi:bifunctional DNase/RNase